MTAAALFQRLFRADGVDLRLSEVRVHPGADALCAAWGARALTAGSDIYFRTGAFAPHTPQGLWLLAHEVAHVVQQRRGPVSHAAVAGGLGVGPARGPEEREADAAADAAVRGRPFDFGAVPAAGALGGPAGQLVVQRYMAWEHLVLGDLAPAAVGETVRAVGAGPANGQAGGTGRFGPLTAACALAAELGRSPVAVDEERLLGRYPDVPLVRLPGSGLVVTLGELNILPDYLSNPARISSAPAAFLLPVLQSIRTQNLRELHRVMGSTSSPPRLRGAMRYPGMGGFSEIYEAIEVDSVGKKTGLPAWELYSSVVGRNASHFAPFSWYRWQDFHLQARELIRQSATAPSAERDALRARARLYAGYADHFLQDSFAAGHLINKTLVMQWYVEWLAGSRFPVPDGRLLAAMTAARQPWLHGPGFYDPEPDPDGVRLRPAAGPGGQDMTDPQTAAELGTLAERTAGSGVTGPTDRDRQAAYTQYLALLGSSVAQLAGGVAHAYFNKHSLVAASRADGPRFQLWGDRTLFQGEEGAAAAAAAAGASRQAISELLDRGETGITSRSIFESFPRYVESGGRLLTLPEWHAGRLRELCFGELFGLRSTQVSRVLFTLTSRNLGVPSEDYRQLRGKKTA